MLTSQVPTLVCRQLAPSSMKNKREFPTCGNKQMLGYLHSRVFRVQQTRVRESIWRVEPAPLLNFNKGNIGMVNMQRRQDRDGLVMMAR